MPAFVDSAIGALSRQPDPDPSDIVRAVKVGCTDAEIAGLMGIRLADLQRLIDNDPVLSGRLESLRAKRRFELRDTVHRIATDDDHPAQGRILREILIGELQAEEEAGQTSGAWDRIMAAARAFQGD